MDSTGPICHPIKYINARILDIIPLIAKAVYRAMTMFRVVKIRIMKTKAMPNIIP